MVHFWPVLTTSLWNSSIYFPSLVGLPACVSIFPVKTTTIMVFQWHGMILTFWHHASRPWIWTRCWRKGKCIHFALCTLRVMFHIVDSTPAISLVWFAEHTYVCIIIWGQFSQSLLRLYFIVDVPKQWFSLQRTSMAVIKYCNWKRASIGANKVHHQSERPIVPNLGKLLSNCFWTMWSIAVKCSDFS